MGPTTFNGLPAHPLLVHFVVVLVPLAAILVISSVLWPRARTRLGLATPLVALVTLALVPLTTHAGEWLEHRSERSPLIRAHAHLGDQLLVWSIGVFLAAACWWLLHMGQDNSRTSSGTARKIILIVVGVVAIAAAVGSVVQVYRIGESGAKAVWQDQS